MLIDKFVSVSLMTRKKNSQNYEDFRKKELDFISKVVYELNAHVKQSEVIIIIHDDEEKGYFLSSELPDLSSVSIKVVSTTKRSKEYVLHNLGWKASIGDIVCHFDLAPNLHLQSAYDLIQAILKTTNLTFLVDDKIVHQSRLYQLINSAYEVSVLPVCTRGFVANRQTINSAFSNQSEIFDPFISLGLSGIPFYKFQLTGQTQTDHEWSRYSTQDEIDLLLQYTREQGFQLILEQTLVSSKFIAAVISLLLIVLTNHLSFLTVMMILMMFGIVSFVVCMIYARIKATYILQQHALAASLNKNLAGQIDITTRNSYVSEL